MITIEFYDTVLKYTIEEELPLPKASMLKHFTFGQKMLINYDTAQFVVYADMDSFRMNVYKGMEVIAYLHGEIYWKGRVNVSPSVTKRFKNNMLDEITVNARGKFYDADEKLYTAASEDADGQYQNISTNAYTLIQDLFLDNQFGAYHTGNNVALASNAGGGGCTDMVFDTDNVVNEVVSINNQWMSVRAIDILRQVRDYYNGNLDLFSSEEYLYYLDYLDNFYLQKRSTEVLYRFDMISQIEVDNVTWDIDFNNFKETRDDNIINFVTVNGTELVLTGATEVLRQASINVGGDKRNLKPYAINDANITATEFKKIYQGIALNLLKELTRSSFDLNPYKWLWHPPKFRNLGFYVAVDLDGVEYRSQPLISVQYTYSVDGIIATVDIGTQRASIESRKRAIIEDDREIEPDFDNKPPDVRIVEEEPNAEDRQSDQVKSPKKLLCYAKDVNGISAGSVKFYISTYTIATQTWGAYSLIGGTDWVPPPDSDSEGYYVYDSFSGFYDLEETAGLSPGDIFRIKAVAKDPSGNLGESVKQYQLDITPHYLEVEFVSADVAAEPPYPSTFETATDFKMRIRTDDLSVQTAPTIKYAGMTGITYAKDVDENFWLTSALDEPQKGWIKKIEVQTTNVHGRTLKKVYYVKGIENAISGTSMSTTDYDTSADDTTASVTQYTNKIEFNAHYYDDFLLVDVTLDIEFRIYNKSGALVLTLDGWSSTIPGLIVEEDKGYFRVQTTVTLTGLPAGVYTCRCRLRKRFNFTDEDGNDTIGTTDWELGPPHQFEIASLTQRTRHDNLDTRVGTAETTVADLDTRMPVAEKELNQEYDSASKKFHLKFFEAGDAPGGGGAGLYATNDAYASTPVWNKVDVAATINGIDGPTFTINQDDSAEGTTTIVFLSGATNDAAIRFVESTQSFEFCTDYQNPSPAWQSIGSNAISDTYSGNVYELKVNSTDGSLTFTKDPSGTPATLLKVAADGAIVVYGGIDPDTDATYDIGTVTKMFANIYLRDSLFCADIEDVNGVWSMIYNATAGLLIPKKVALGMMDDS
jgi:hypothetical protein